MSYFQCNTNIPIFKGYKMMRIFHSVRKREKKITFSYITENSRTLYPGLTGCSVTYYPNHTIHFNSWEISSIQYIFSIVIQYFCKKKITIKQINK